MTDCNCNCNCKCECKPKPKYDSLDLAHQVYRLSNGLSIKDWEYAIWLTYQNEQHLYDLHPGSIESVAEYWLHRSNQKMRAYNKHLDEAL